MKKIFKVTVVLAALICCLAAVSLTASAEEQVKELNTVEDLQQLFLEGGAGRITGYIDARDQSLEIRNNKTVKIYTGNTDLIFSADRVSIAGELILVGEEKGKPGCLQFVGPEEREDVTVRGRLILDKVDLFANRIAGGGYIYCNCGSVRVKNISCNCITFMPSAYAQGLSQRISSDQFMEMVESGKLMDVTCPEYAFQCWINENHEVVTEMDTEGVHSYHPIWKAESGIAASSFGEGSIWKILTAIFAVTTVMFAALYLRNRKNA